MTSSSSHTTDVTRDERRQLEAQGIGVERSPVTGLVIENDKLRAVELNDGRMIERTAVFVRPGNTPHNDGLLAELGCQTSDAGFAIVDTTGRTSNPRVWAAGNVVDPRAQVI